MNAAGLVLQDIIRMVISTLHILKLNTHWQGLDQSEAEEAQYHKVNLARSA